MRLEFQINKLIYFGWLRLERPIESPVLGYCNKICLVFKKLKPNYVDLSKYDMRQCETIGEVRSVVGANKQLLNFHQPFWFDIQDQCVYVKSPWPHKDNLIYKDNLYLVVKEHNIMNVEITPI